MKRYKVITITKPASGGDENMIDWATNGTALHTDLYNDWTIEQISTTSASEGQLSLTLLLSSISKDFDIEDV